MSRKKTLDEIKNLDFLLIGELATFNDIRYSTIKYYTELELLPYEQEGRGLAKYYPKVKASARIKDILKMREQGKSIPEIITYFTKKIKL